MADRTCGVDECDRGTTVRGMCNLHYQRWMIQNPDSTQRPSKPVLERYSARVRKLGPDECWPWIGTVDAHGYGRIYRDHRFRSATRTGWALINGTEVPDGLFVCHTCDNPPCNNPSHWFLGTAKDNHEDMTRKGRRTFAGPKPKLSLADIELIRNSLTGRRGEQNELAHRYGVSRSLISLIVKHGHRSEVRKTSPEHKDVTP